MITHEIFLNTRIPIAVIRNTEHSSAVSNIIIFNAVMHSLLDFQGFVPNIKTTF